MLRLMNSTLCLVVSSLLRSTAALMLCSKFSNSSALILDFSSSVRAGVRCRSSREFSFAILRQCGRRDRSFLSRSELSCAENSEMAREHSRPTRLRLCTIRSERRKSEIAPLFVPRDNTGYLIITFPKCLRPNRLEAMGLNGGLHQTTCQLCGMPVSFEINHEIEPLMKRNQA